MLKTIKGKLIKTKIYAYYKKKNGKEQKAETASILEKEFDYAMNIMPESMDALCGRIRLRIHGFEKVLVQGGIPSQEGLGTLYPLVEKLLNMYPKYPRSGDVIVETIGIAKSVILANGNAGIDCEESNKELAHFIKQNQLEDVSPREIRIVNVCNDDRPNDISNLYEEIVKSRHSIRKFEPKLVDEKDLQEIIRIAAICPSACNRQPCKVYYTNDPESIRKLFPDKGVTKDVFNLLFITVNKSFYNVKELFQPWIDGGIFVESLIMAIHARGYGTCPFQYVKSNPNYQELKDRLGIPSNEDVVCCVGMGYLKDTYNIIETHRKDVSEIMVRF